MSSHLRPPVRELSVAQETDARFLVGTAGSGGCLDSSVCCCAIGGFSTVP
jgi:hypothetical protein